MMSQEKSTARVFCRLAGMTLLTMSCLAGFAAAQRYEMAGKRDPFVNPAHTRQKMAPSLVEPPPFAKRPPGLPGLLISEVTVVGTAAHSQRRIVVLRGVDEFTYIAKEGARLYDGYIESVSTEEVVFIKENLDTAGNKTTQKVVKQYYTEGTK